VTANLLAYISPFVAGRARIERGAAVATLVVQSQQNGLQHNHLGMVTASMTNIRARHSAHTEIPCDRSRGEGGA
jgi:hypothetical protein